MAMISHANHRAGRALLPMILAAIVFGAGLTPAGTPSLVAAAEPSADIPGVPFPGAVAAGRLGGSIYDVVYRISVPAGYVMLASLTGAATTDFDMYLFDATATTVLSLAGQLTKSIGPTSSESIAWPSRLGGTYYIDLNGATNLEGDYRLTVQAVPDPSPPTVSMVLAGGRGSTNLLAVPVTLTAGDDLSGVAEMAFSLDGVTYTSFEPFQPTTTWTFEPGGGSMTLWAKVKNGIGTDSIPAIATVAIDTTAPSATAMVPAPGSSVVGLRPLFSVAFDEPMDPATWTDLGLIVQSASGALIPGSFAYDTARRTGTFVPASALQPGATYAVNLGDVTDIAGNPVLPTGSWTITPMAPTALEKVTGPPVVARGVSTRLDLALTGAPAPAVVEVSQRSSATADFVPLTIMEAVNGLVSLAVTPALNTTYRFRYPGAFGVAPAQLDVPVLVRRSVALVGRSSSVIARARVGSSVKLTAAVGPAAAGVSVSFRVYRFDNARRVWVYAGSRGRNTDAAGRATTTWVPPSAGSWYWRAVVASTADFANNTSPVYRWSISR
jgi:hypothetical protein